MKKCVNGKYFDFVPNEEYEQTEDYKLFRIEELKQYLSDTDYIACKIAEGCATAEEYSDELKQRQTARDEINRLNLEINNI